jgi:hypothetical protein
MRLIVASICLAACTDGSGFAGDYETVTTTRGGCDVPGVAEPVIDDAHWFRLGDVEQLVGYFPCVAPGECRSEHDLYRSFGHEGEQWITTIAIALEPGCTLRYRERTLDRLDDTSIVIDDVAYEEVDPALSGDACSISEARRRATTMPCVQRVELVAETR